MAKNKMVKKKMSKHERKQIFIKIGCLLMVVAMVIPTVSPIINSLYQEEGTLSPQELESLKSEIESQGYRLVENEDGSISVELSAEKSAELAMQELEEELLEAESAKGEETDDVEEVEIDSEETAEAEVQSDTVNESFDNETDK